MFKTKKDKLEKELLKEELENINIPIKETTEEENTLQEEEQQNQGEQSDRIELENQVKFYKDQLLRKAAEFENYKKRTEAETSNVYRYANEALIRDLLPVLDDFNRIKKSWDEKHDLESFKKAFELVYEKFVKVLQKQGVKEMDVLGKEFDVNLHEALMQAPDADAEPNTVTGVIENGYYLKDKVLRHAKVIVSSNSNQEKENK